MYAHEFALLFLRRSRICIPAPGVRRASRGPIKEDYVESQEMRESDLHLPCPRKEEVLQRPLRGPGEQDGDYLPVRPRGMWRYGSSAQRHGRIQFAGGSGYSGCPPLSKEGCSGKRRRTVGGRGLLCFYPAVSPTHDFCAIGGMCAKA